MQIFRSLSIAIISSALTACADLYTQEPAPVFGGIPEEGQYYPAYPIIPSHQPPSVQEPPVTETRPLEGYNRQPEMVEIKPDLPPPVEPQAVPPDMNSAGQSSQPTDPFAAEQPGETAPPETETPTEQPKPSETTAPVAPPVAEVPKQPEELQPLETFAPQTPAVGSLVMAANEESQGGNLGSAVASIERAIRIEPRNATLYYKLAVLRLKQSKPRLAEDLARKAALLAVNDNNLKKHSWLLVANARELQSNVEGAKKAKAEADKY
ncbi:hypothetical protein MCAMS1_00759 [biofilm metagenome]